MAAVGRLGVQPRAGLCFSGVARGPNLFGPARARCADRRHARRFPLAGFYANGEILNHGLYGYKGVLVLFP